MSAQSGAGNRDDLGIREIIRHGETRQSGPAIADLEQLQRIHESQHLLLHKLGSEHACRTSPLDPGITPTNIHDQGTSQAPHKRVQRTSNLTLDGECQPGSMP